MIPDPLITVRDLLLADLPVTALAGDRVYATPLLPAGHSYPLIRLTHIGSSDYAPVGFRQALTAIIQLDVFAHDQPAARRLAETALVALHRRHHTRGLLHIRPSSEVADLDETAQPPLYRYRADLLVRLAAIPEPAAP